MAAISQKQKISDLCTLLTQLENPKDMYALLQDLCTEKEIANMAERAFAAKLLLQGMTYNEVVSQANISSATLSRVSRSIQQGSGYKKLLKDQ